MTSHCDRYVVVYNGEVYNFDEIRKKILTINWKTNSDTEVILEAFVKWGVDFVHQLNGMFAIAIYDIYENILYLFRDRVDIKPLFYSFQNEQLIFASEIKSINKLNINKTISYNAVYDYLHLGYITGNQSIYNEIRKVNQVLILFLRTKKLLKNIIGHSKISFTTTL